MAVRHLGHDVGGRGRDDDQIIVARETDVPDVEFAVLVEQLDERLFPRDRADRHRRDEFLRGARHHHAHRDAALAQAADQVERLVGRDAARDDEQHASARRVSRRFGSPGRLGRTRRPRGSGFRGPLGQQQPDFLLHGAAVRRRAQPQPLLDALRQVADRQGAHSGSLAHDCIAINAIKPSSRSPPRAARRSPRAQCASSGCRAPRLGRSPRPFRARAPARRALRHRADR